MAHYHTSGSIPHKRHTQFRKPDGSLYSEELVSSEGFSSIYSNLYHINPPTRVKQILAPVKYGPKKLEEYSLLQMHLNTSKVERTGDDYLSARKVLDARAP